MKSTHQKKDNGSGSIYSVDDGKRWKAEISWKDHTGKMHRKSFSAKKKTEVKKKLEEFKKELEITRGDADPDEVTFEEFACTWMSTKQKLALKPSSYLRKDVTLRNQVYPIRKRTWIPKIFILNILD